MIIALICLLGPGNMIVSKAFENISIAAPSIMLFQVWAAAIAYMYVGGITLRQVDIIIVLVISLLVLWLGIRFYA